MAFAPASMQMMQGIMEVVRDLLLIVRAISMKSSSKKDQLQLEKDVGLDNSTTESVEENSLKDNKKKRNTRETDGVERFKTVRLCDAHLEHTYNEHDPTRTFIVNDSESSPNKVRIQYAREMCKQCYRLCNSRLHAYDKAPHSFSGSM